MSRIGKKPIVLPAGVTVEQNAAVLTVKGPKGTLTQEVHPKVTIKVEANEGSSEVIVDVAKKEDKREKALWGLFRSLVQNMVDGVTTGYTKQLDIVGVGFKAEARGQELVLSLGFSHPINFAIPQGVEVKVEKDPAKIGLLQYQTTVTLTGINKQLVGQTAANLRELKKPEPYKGKGIKYSDETIMRKAGKVVKAVGK